MSISLPHPRASRRQRQPAAAPRRPRADAVVATAALAYLAALGAALALYANVALGVVVPLGITVLVGSYVATFTSRPRR
jgi:hypothetical protein